ncbi:hypothetical protein CRE_20941 [Caenorhabditis remanei]|uniref:Uncharacterized protein n=1 Tax=Caenorhabditis remanei TaxID=31234 RepID=E3N925_CAERE|nr:hypothetical protein CRE_20941 [Caenorhabditis remanei]
MAYVESHYLELNSEQDSIDNVDAQQVENIQPLVDDSQKAMPKSDYCGFEGDGIPPVYRAQLPVSEKTKLSTAEPKSSYIYGKDEKEKSMSEENVLMENEDPIEVTRKTEMESEILHTSSHVTSSIATTSCLPHNQKRKLQMLRSNTLDPPPICLLVLKDNRKFCSICYQEITTRSVQDDALNQKINRHGKEEHGRKETQVNCSVIRETDDGKLIISYDRGNIFYFLSEKELEDEKKGKKVVRENKKEEKKEEKTSKHKKEKKKDEKSAKKVVEVKNINWGASGA